MVETSCSGQFCRYQGGGRFQAQESGLGNAAGPAYFTQAGTFRIDYVTRDDSISGYYEVRFSPDGRTASGTVANSTARAAPGTRTARVDRGAVGSRTFREV